MDTGKFVVVVLFVIAIIVVTVAFIRARLIDLQKENEALWKRLSRAEVERDNIETEREMRRLSDEAAIGRFHELLDDSNDAIDTPSDEPDPKKQ